MSNLCDYSDADIPAKGTINLAGQGADAAAIQTDQNNEKVIFKNSTLFTDCITEINNTQVDDAKGLDVVMLMYNLIEYCYNFPGTTGILKALIQPIYVSGYWTLPPFVKIMQSFILMQNTSKRD